MKIERTGMIDYEIRRIGIFVFINRFFFSVFAIKFLCIFINFPKIDDFEKWCQQNVTKSIVLLGDSRVAGPGRIAPGRVESGRL